MGSGYPLIGLAKPVFCPKKKILFSREGPGHCQANLKDIVIRFFTLFFSSNNFS
jgi:hypothetical protein